MNINDDQFLYEDITQNEEILQNQSSKNYLLGKNEPTNLLFAFSFLSTHLRLGSHVHMKTKSTMSILLIGRGFPPTHFPAPIKSNIRTSKYQEDFQLFS